MVMAISGVSRSDGRTRLITWIVEDELVAPMAWNGRLEDDVLRPVFDDAGTSDLDRVTAGALEVERHAIVVHMLAEGHDHLQIGPLHAIQRPSDILERGHL